MSSLPWESRLAELRQRDPRAAALIRRTRGKTSIIGIENEGEFVPLFKLDGVLSVSMHDTGLYYRYRFMPWRKADHGTET